jgi:hypothetical protein
VPNADLQLNQENAMSKKRDLILKLSGAVILPALCAANMAAAAAAPAVRAPRTFTSTVTHTGPAGNTYTRQSTLSTNGQGGFTANSTLTGPKGNTIATRQQSGTYDPATKTYTSSGTITGPNGKQSNFQTTVQGTGSGYVRNSTLTGPNGNTVTTTGQGTYNASAGTFNQSRTTTFPNGQTASENRTVAIAPAGQTPGN